MKYNKPPLDGIISLKILKEPISLQSKGDKKKELKKNILENLKKLEFSIASDVAVEIIWIINEWDRIKSSSTPDVDNIIKPILDAISGIGGILIDDSQIKEVNCKWEHSDFVDVKLIIKIKMLGKAYFKRNDIFFLEYDDKFVYLLIKVIRRLPISFWQIFIKKCLQITLNLELIIRHTINLNSFFRLLNFIIAAKYRKILNI